MLNTSKFTFSTSVSTLLRLLSFTLLFGAVLSKVNATDDSGIMTMREMIEQPISTYMTHINPKSEFVEGVYHYLAYNVHTGAITIGLPVSPLQVTSTVTKRLKGPLPGHALALGLALGFHKVFEILDLVTPSLTGDGGLLPGPLNSWVPAMVTGQTSDYDPWDIFAPDPYYGRNYEILEYVDNVNGEYAFGGFIVHNKEIVWHPIMSHLAAGSTSIDYVKQNYENIHGEQLPWAGHPDLPNTVDFGNPSLPIPSGDFFPFDTKAVPDSYATKMLCALCRQTGMGVHMLDPEDSDGWYAWNTAKWGALSQVFTRETFWRRARWAAGASIAVGAVAVGTAAAPLEAAALAGMAAFTGARMAVRRRSF